MSVKKLLVAGSLGMVLCVPGYGNGEKVDSNEEFPTDDISKIVIDISSWNIEVPVSSDDKIHVGYKGKAKSSSNVQITQKDNTLMILKDACPETDTILCAILPVSRAKKDVPARFQ